MGQSLVQGAGSNLWTVGYVWTLKFRILVVDDEECIREVFGQLLQREGYEVATAKDGFDALLKLKQFLPDVIISDLNMPRMSGFEFLSVVRRRFLQRSPSLSATACSWFMIRVRACTMR
jgi:CheY-like chemotaxis protein